MHVEFCTARPDSFPVWLNHRGGPTGDVSVVQALCLLPSVGGGPVFILANSGRCAVVSLSYWFLKREEIFHNAMWLSSVPLR